MLNKDRATICKLKQDIPNGAFRYAFDFVFGILNEQGKVSFGCVFHEEI